MHVDLYMVVNVEHFLLTALKHKLMVISTLCIECQKTSIQ